MKTRQSSAILVLLVLSLSTALVHAGDWPQWRGPDRNDISKETGLLKQWPTGGPKQVWLFKDAGLGYAGYSIAAGKLFTMGARDEKEFLIAVDVKDGKELWSTPMATLLKNGWGDGPRGTPTVDGKYVYAISGQGTLICANVEDGKEQWRVTMQSLGGKTPQWGYTESVLVDGKQLLCTPGGDKGAVVALDKLTGKVLWQSGDFTDGAQYASIVTADLNGARQYIQLTMKSVVGLNAKDGKTLWRADWPGKTAVIPTPIERDGLVYVTAGYGVGCQMVKVGSGNQLSGVYTNKVMKNHHGGVILVGNHLYGYSDGSGWVCQDFKTGAEVWASKNLGKGAIAYADGMLYLLDEDSGTVALIEASPRGWSEKSRFKLEPQTTQRKRQGRIWTHPVISNGKLYLRDQELLFCFDVKAK
jgi:outer membrane protein assembly factor BamB